MSPNIISIKTKVTFSPSDLLSPLTSETGNAADLKSASPDRNPASAAAKVRASFVSLTQERESLS